MILDQEYGKFGYYIVNNRQYLLKTEALAAANGDVKKLKFVFNDDIYDRFDWKRDPFPDLSISDLYRMRAQELRDNNDYIVVMFSGGPDSTNMLESFVHNGIKVDEIVNYNSYESTRVVEGTLNNADYFYNVKPKLEALSRDFNFNPKITILDEVVMAQVHWRSMYESGWDDMSWDFGGPTMWLARGYIVKYLPHLMDIINQGKRLAIINAHEKPLSKIIDGKYALIFSDMPRGNYYEMTKELGLLSSNHWHWFYHAPSTAPLIIKQAHILKNFVDSNPEPEFYRHEVIAPGYRPSHSWGSKNGHGNLRYDIFHKLIYPNWTPRVVTPKPSNLVTRPQDNWWMKDLKVAEKSIWEHSVKNFVKKHNSDIKHSVSIQSSLIANPRFIE